MDVLEAKQMLSGRLLSAAADRGVIRFRTLSIAAAALSAGQNLHAVGVGRKLVEGSLTEQPCVRFYVTQKLPESVLAADDVLPKAVDGIVTDVIEALPAFVFPNGDLPPGVPMTAATACTDNRRGRQRPVIAGTSAANFRVTAGTISCFCRSTDQQDVPGSTFVLSNNHVFADVNRASVGDGLSQPGPADGGTTADSFALLHRFVSIQLGGHAGNRVDAAIGRVLSDIPTDSQICTIGHLSGVAEAQENMTVCKHGRTTGYTEGLVFDSSVDALVGMDHNDASIVALFQNQLRINVASPFTAFGLGGDSGSLVLDKTTRQAVGLYNAGPPGGDYGLANRIQDVVSELRIELLP